MNQISPKSWNDNPVKNDLLYHGNRSGGKITSPLIDVLVGETGALSETAKRDIAQCVLMMFGATWDGFYKTLVAEYDFTKDFSRSETYSGTDERTAGVDRTVTTAYGKTETDTTDTAESSTGTSTNATTYGKTETKTDSATDTTTYGKTEKTTGANTDTTVFGKTETETTQVSAYDTDDFVNERKISRVYGGDDTTTHDLNATITNGGKDDVTHTAETTSTYGGTDSTAISDKTENTIKNTRSVVHGGTDNNAEKTTNTDNNESNYTKTTNGYNTPVQDLISKQRETLMFNFYTKVFSDIDSVLTIPIY